MTKHHILAIDDDVDTLKLLVEMLRGRGYALRATLDSMDGYHKAIDHPPDLILLDISMPDLDGHHLCRLLRENPATQNIPIIFLTGRGSLPDKLEGFESGCNDYIVKPYHADEIVARIQAQLMSHQRSQQTAKEIITPSTKEKPLSHNEQLLQNATKLLLNNMENPPTLKELAKKIHTNDRTLTNIFHRHFGVPVFTWLRKERLKRACKLLLESEYPVSEIAAIVGFTHAAFCSAFKEHYGLTPSHYRKSGGLQPDLSDQ